MDHKNHHTKFRVYRPDGNELASTEALTVGEPVAPRPASPTPLSMPELKSLISELKASPSQPHLWEIAALVALTGIRRSELQNLRWPDVDFCQKKVVITCTKNQAKREIPLLPKLEKILQARKDRDRDAEFVLGARPECVVRQLSAALRNPKDLKNRRVSLHLLRLSFVCMLFNWGCPAFVVGKLAGYSSLFSVIKFLGSEAAIKASAIRSQEHLEDELLAD